ncbi:interleukin-18 receptor 1-like [Odontesthes bonariensis]|uniref:interleukin-18 receptor 1-like n=1 Tax=Odontesthes bonariensis TaxID=219752 RepID=UPI003F58290C
MMVKMLLALLLAPLTLLTSVHSLRTKLIYVMAGELVALHCQSSTDQLIWTSHTRQEVNVKDSVSASADQSHLGVLIYGRSLVILRASVDHQGNYSCSLGNASRKSWFRLTVYTTQTRENEGRGQYPVTCYTPGSCTLHCPVVDIPAADSPNITVRDIAWTKDGQPSKHYFTTDEKHYFRTVEQYDSGVYTCTRSYLYDGEIYNKSFDVPLQVRPEKNVTPVTIDSPRDGVVFPVELGTTVVIDCRVNKVNSCSDSLYWLNVTQLQDKSPVFYNFTCNNNTGKKTASLVFKEVFAEHLLKHFTCISKDGITSPQFVTITLTKKPLRSYISLVQCVISIVAVTAVTAIIYVKFKIDITLFFRDTLGCRRRTSDGKSYDAFLMSYMSNTHGGLNEDDREWLESTLEERFGYRLCLHDRDVLPGDAVAEAVLNCVEQSRTVVLVPSSQASEHGSGLLSAIHAALVERHTRLIFINTEQIEMSRSGSLAEALQLLSKAGHCVTWKGRQPSSTFWKQLRYNLPATQSVGNAGSHRLFNVL